jgi:hypothetical protein
VVEGVYAERENGGCSADADAKRGEIKPTYAPPAAGEPRGEGDNAGDDVPVLRLHDGEIVGARGQDQYCGGEDISGRSWRGCRQAGNRASEDVQNQKREPHASTSSQHPMRSRLSKDNTRFATAKFLG